MKQITMLIAHDDVIAQCPEMFIATSA